MHYYSVLYFTVDTVPYIVWLDTKKLEHNIRIKSEVKIFKS